MNITEKHSEVFAEVDGQEYSIEVTANPDKDYHTVTVKLYQPALKWWKTILAESVYDCHSDLEAIRHAFRTPLGKMRNWVQSWQDYRGYAAQEKGGKRAYYTKHANEAKRHALEYAPKWKLCKQLWKEITKL